MEKDTICAISTPFGISGIGIIRLSGKSTYSIIEKIFKPKKNSAVKDIPSHTVTYGHIINSTGKVIDEVLITFMRNPKSYTREDMAEIGCHGGIITLKEVLNLCIKQGARLAEPGEFTKRAFLNGRIDLTQAESVMEIINSRTEHSLSMSLNKLKGRLYEALENIKEQLISLLSGIEAKINFPEEDDTKNYNIQLSKTINDILSETESFLNQAGKGRILYEGINVAIVGRTNAGKSSLLNKLAGEEKAIVTEIPGTTRDSIQETINIRGVPINIIDTAGIRNVRSKIEKLGLKKSFEWIEKAEIVLLMIDGTKKINDFDLKLLNKIREKPYILIINKIDLPLKVELNNLKKSFNEERIILLSALTGEGLHNLEEKIYSLIQEGYGKIEDSRIFLNIRQESQLRGVYQKLKTVQEDVYIKDNLEIVAEYINSCIKDIDELTGKNINQEVLNNIFSQFCVGK
ncbi:tRNA uridine-5-carboxymethylaminomethyl(34) synthesis GTPase MnmE [bacterium]|nr:tRNA uridine-5-carboxymethylaminomethyl(34) synthesis GTPase MnmE [bacterium]